MIQKVVSSGVLAGNEFPLHGAPFPVPTSGGGVGGSPASAPAMSKPTTPSSRQRGTSSAISRERAAGHLERLEFEVEPEGGTDLTATVPLHRHYDVTREADLIEEVNGVRMHPSMPIDEARAICDRLKVPYESGWGAGRLMSEVYDETCEATLTDPTFVYDYPREVSPLARSHREDPDMVERFEAVVGGRELANAYSELNDAVDQRARFEAEGDVIVVTGASWPVRCLYSLIRV